MADSDRKSPGGENLSVGNVVRLGRCWTATILSDNSIILQHLSQVCIGGSGEVVDLLDMNLPYDSAQYYMGEMDEDRVGVRTLLLRTNGAVVTDPDAISPSGVLSEDAYEAIPDTQQSSRRYFSRSSNKGDW
jgi:hypothetical protein